MRLAAQDFVFMDKIGPTPVSKTPEACMDPAAGNPVLVSTLQLYRPNFIIAPGAARWVPIWSQRPVSKFVFDLSLVGDALTEENLSPSTASRFSTL